MGPLIFIIALAVIATVLYVTRNWTRRPAEDEAGDTERERAQREADRALLYETEKLAQKFGLPNPTVDKFEAGRAARMESIEMMMDRLRRKQQ